MNWQRIPRIYAGGDKLFAAAIGTRLDPYMMQEDSEFNLDYLM